MHFEHTPSVSAAFPTLVPGILLVDAIQPDVDISAQLPALLARARARLAGAAESDLPEVQAWRRAFSQMGLKPTRYRSAAGALLRRFRKEDSLPALHASAAADIIAPLGTLKLELRGAGFTPLRRAILTAAAPRWEGDSRQ